MYHVTGEQFRFIYLGDKKYTDINITNDKWIPSVLYTVPRYLVVSFPISDRGVSLSNQQSHWPMYALHVCTNTEYVVY